MGENSRNSLSRDGGYASRKFWFALISSVLILFASRISPIAVIAEVIAGIVMVCSIYVAGNAVVKWRSGSIEQTKIINQAPASPKQISSKEPDVMEIPEQ
jgi:hypothetical protein